MWRAIVLVEKHPQHVSPLHTDMAKHAHWSKHVFSLEDGKLSEKLQKSWTTQKVVCILAPEAKFVGHESFQHALLVFSPELGDTMLEAKSVGTALPLEL